ncbi:hypothetical protein K5Q02_08785 [Pseudomonas sp. MM211]|uniref:hypothetical protein n=1 Tax=Pseudomonas sp. MM211 TaxID=2866808 RepID=UPI001CEC4DE7|nr:hypothetical protein [Pseudomonas sp. MM211]UCJ18442.1 hypothetical protein K5Q02_08785 [Pseudomonas sp. MM211]
MLSGHLFLPVFALLTLLGACTQYREVPPQTAEGQACVQQCNETQRACERREDESYQGFKVIHDSQNQSYQNCLHSTEDPNLKTLCPKPTAIDGPDYRTCSEVYKNCFVTCGGSYEKIE